MPVDGTPKFSTMAVAEIEADLKGGNIKLACKAAFVDRVSGATHAWTRGEGAIWSPDTMACLEALRASMENDLAARHFMDFASTTPARSVQHTPPDRVGGLGEYLDEADQG